jgi:2,4-dienoyl-CoA reductase (NADPH2)
MREELGMDNNLSILFEPFSIKDLKLKNRIVMAPMHTKFASESGEVTDRLTSYLCERARGGLGLIILENTCIDWVYGRAAGNPVTIHDDLNRTGLSNLVLAVHRYGAKIVTQLHFTGRQNLRSNIVGGLAPVAPSPVKSNIGGDEPRALEESEIEDIIQKYVDAARRTKECGFDGVELHAAHGYIFTQFFSPLTNLRNDKWGGSFENRARFPLEVVRRIRAEVGTAFPILYRLSVEERVPGGTTLEDSLKLVKLLDEAGVDCFDVTAGIYDSMEWIFTTHGVEPGSLLPLAEKVKGVTDKPVIGISRLGWDLDFSAQAIKDNKVDLVSIGRSFLADPYIPKKYQQGREKEIRPCISCNDCVGMMFQGWRVHCIINPLLGNEYLDPVKPTLEPKKVVVVGGGPAGMECACVAAERGHDVTVVEKSERLGGLLPAAAKPEYKRQEMEAIIDYYTHMLEKLGVNVILNKEIKDELPSDIDADIVVLATGAIPQISQWKGSKYMVTALDVLMSGGTEVGQNIVVIGASGVGIDVALFLKENVDRNITVIEKQSEIGGDVNDILKANLLQWADEKEIKFITNCEAVSVEEGKVHVETPSGDETFSCDTIVSAIGFASLVPKKLKTALEEKGIEVFTIGSASEPGKIFDATQSGFWTGVEL